MSSPMLGPNQPTSSWRHLQLQGWNQWGVSFGCGCGGWRMGWGVAWGVQRRLWPCCSAAARRQHRQRRGSSAAGQRREGWSLQGAAASR